MPRTQYIFIDYENVGETDFSRVVGKPVQVFLIVGPKQSKLPTSLFLFTQSHPEQIRIIQTPVEGRNALDFVLTFELGRLFAADPAGYFHIVSKDRDYDSVVQHLKAQNRFVARYGHLSEIPALRTSDQSLLSLKAELSDATKGRPRTRKKLENKIKSTYGNQAAPELVERTIKNLVQSGILAFGANDKVEYQKVA